MAAVQGEAPNADAFDTFFRIADLDRDGRISGGEAVAFFQGFSLPKETLALVWSYAAGGNSSLGRMEFYNALRLVTVAQSGRQLTADIVKAALYGPAAAKIPAPKINPSSSSALQANQMVTPPAQVVFMRPPTSQLNSIFDSSPQENNILPQSAPTGFVRPSITSQMTASPLPQSSQSGSMRPPAPQIKSMTSSSLQTNNLLQQSPQAGFVRPPQISSAVTSAPQVNNMSLQPAQAGFMRPPASQHTGLSGQQMPMTASLNLQGPSFPHNNFTRLPQAPQVSGSLPVQGFSEGFNAPSSSSSTLSTDWLAGRGSGLQGAVPSQFPNNASFPDKDGFRVVNSTQEAASKQQIQHVISSPAPSRLFDSGSTSFQTSLTDSKSSVVSGNGFSSDLVFGGDSFLATQTQQDTSLPISSTSISKSSDVVPLAPKNYTSPGQTANQQVTTGLPPAANQMQKNQPPVKQNQLDTMHNTSIFTVASIPSGPDSSLSTQNDVPWPKITQSDIRKYIKVFHEVDKDRDGKITGSEARNLFLSWRLPREVLRQVWDLSDQDSDSMLSMREFCIALYLMERYREGRSLPPVLPNSVKFDQILVLATGQLSSAYGASAWQQRPASSQQQTPESLSVVPPTRLEPSSRISIPSQPDVAASPVQQKPRVPVLDQNFVNQLSEEEQKALNVKSQEATDADNKVQELEKQILDYKQKTENFRKQMQEIVLYKSRCDSRLNETIERTAADKREVELLARKYEEKYKQMGDLTSKLTADQTTFRDIQDRKVELYNLIALMDKGEISDGVLQEHADKVQADLDELVKALNDRCKDYGLRAKPTSLIELPFGWQPTIQVGAADWDETWDMFDKDDGFTTIKELTLKVENIVPLEKLKVTSDSSVEVTATGVLATPSKASDNATKEEPASKVEGSTDKSLSTGTALTGAELPIVQNEDDLQSTPPGSPGRSATGSPSREFQSTSSPHAHAKEHHSEHDGPESGVLRDKFTDEVSWGATFDSDDTDSIWGFSPIKTKETVRDVKRLDSFSGPGDFGLNSFGTEYSPSAASVFGKERSPFYDSVPSTPAFNSGFSPKFSQGPEERSFDSFSRFDSFSLNDNVFPSSGALTRFDSMSSTTYQPRDTFSRFDSFSSTADTQREFSRFDSIRSTAESRETLARFDSMRSTAEPRETLARFDSIKSSADYNHGFSFDDSDPFGSGPFRTSENHASKKSSDHWSSF
ncbi:hypothetical protein KSP39_PZI012818 [Platanthera zijinensis]|uniref:Uncharacterized protein n=1 Tax=Platanthera zijinensis TaxID=2320716 RepID=A0AAP0BDZ8_9ASPA